MSKHKTESAFVAHESCPKCGSEDNLARYDDGHGYCFGCDYYEHSGETGDGPVANTDVPSGDSTHLPSGTVEALSARRISEDTCRKWGYQVGKLSGRNAQFAVYRDDAGVPVATKVRYPDKSFVFLGDTKKAGLYGKWLWNGGGKMLVITEGEIDALSVSEAQGNKYPVVSVKTGAKGALKDIKKDYEWVCSFDKVILWFDNDEPGKEAAIACAEALPPGKAHIVKADLKDANEYLKAGRSGDIINLVWRAEAYRPDGIVGGADLWEAVRVEDTTRSIAYPFAGLNSILKGLREGELVTVTAGTGVGKSAFVRELAYHLAMTEEEGKRENIGLIFLEESVKRTALGLMALHLNKPIHINRDGVSEEELKEAFSATVGREGVYFYDHFGSTEIDNLLNRIRYLAKGCDCKWIILDHLSIVVSGLEVQDERRAIDEAMTRLRTLVQETGVGLILVSHLRRPSGDKGHEQGGEVSLNQLRGSHAIAQLSDAVISLERNQQAEDEEDRNKTLVRVLKNRFTGETGPASMLSYSPQTGRLTESEFDYVDEEEEEQQTPPF